MTTGPGAIVSAAGPAQAALLAALHADIFTADPWHESAMASLLGNPATVGLVVQAGDDPAGLALATCVAEEAEILTFGIRPVHRRAGLGRILLEGLAAAVIARGAEKLLLEVAETNMAALALYEAAGFDRAGRRLRYYADGADAIIMARRLI